MSNSPYDKPPPEKDFSGSPYDPPGASPYAGAPYFPPDSISNDDKMWALIAHLSGWIASLLGGLTFLGPLVIYLVKKDESPFVADQAKEALNFQLAVLVVGLISVITCIGPLIVAVGALVYSIIAAMEANKGIAYRYPYTIRFIS